MNLSAGVTIAREISLDLRRGTDGAVVVATKRVKEDGDGCGVRRRRAALRMVDRQLAKGNSKLALSLVKQLQRQPPSAGLRGFAAARQVYLVFHAITCSTNRYCYHFSYSFPFLSEFNIIQAINLTKLDIIHQ